LHKYISELRNFAMFTMKKILKNFNKDSQENIEFMSEILNFDLCRCRDVFNNLKTDPHYTFHYDIEHFQKTEDISDIKSIKLSKPLEIKFVLNQEQRDVIKRSINLYGLSDIGVSRILTKVFVKKLFRLPITISPITST